MGKPEDAKALYPFAHSTNDYVALAAARALIRLGDKTKGADRIQPNWMNGFLLLASEVKNDVWKK